MLTHFSISQTGKRHIEKKEPGQDFSASKRIVVDHFKSEMILAAVADGVGTCEYSQFGSAIAVKSFLDSVEYNIQNNCCEPTNDNIINIIRYAFQYALSQVEKESEKREIPFLEFDSTLTGIVYDGHNLWFGHIGDDGVVVLYFDGEYEMITERHKGEEAHSLFPLRQTDLWQFGRSRKEVASCVLMTDGVLDYCVDVERMGNRVYFPFLEPALIEPAFTDDDAEKQRLDWAEYLSGNGDYPENFREKVSDDISIVVVQNPDLIKLLPPVQFDFDRWDEDTEKSRKELDDALYADYRAYKAGTYHSPVAQPSGFYYEKKSKSQGISSDSSFTKRNGVSQEQIASDYHNEDEEADDDFDVIITEAADVIKDVFKSAHCVGQFVRKQFTPKRKRDTPLQEMSVAGDNEVVECNLSSEDSSGIQHEVPSKETVDEVDDSRINMDEK